MPPNALSQDTVESVRRALERYSRASAEEPAAELRAALQGLAREAREKQLTPEQLLVVLKGVWYGLPDVRTAGAESEQVRVLQRVVTMCIKEYFAD